eukprot:Amastigsp_a176390_40.p6 type:complete len:112 gc:universal Amastigsp_a176390_40:2331-1996(-)
MVRLCPRRSSAASWATTRSWGLCVSASCESSRSSALYPNGSAARSKSATRRTRRTQPTVGRSVRTARTPSARTRRRSSRATTVSCRCIRTTGTLSICPKTTTPRARCSSTS